MGWVFANGQGDQGLIPGQVIPKIKKMVLDTSLLNTLHYKVWIKGKVEQSSKRCSDLPYTNKIRAFVLPSTMVANFTFTYIINIYIYIYIIERERERERERESHIIEILASKITFLKIYVYFIFINTKVTISLFYAFSSHPPFSFFFSFRRCLKCIVHNFSALDLPSHLIKKKGLFFNVCLS